MHRPLVAKARKCAGSTTAQLPLSVSTQISHSRAVSRHQHMHFFGAHIPFLQVVDAWLQILSSRRSKALRESTVLLFLTSRTFDVPRVIVLSSVVTTASFLPQIVASASMTDSSSSPFSFKLCRLSTGDEYVVPLGRYPYLDLNENGYISLVELCFVVASSP
jgi:hypothetical protein